MGGRSTPETTADASGALFERGELSDYARYVRGSVRRHPILCLSVIIAMVGLAVALGQVMPKRYTAETRLLAMPQDPEAAAQRKAKDANPDAIAAAAVILRTEQLEKLVDQFDLVTNFMATRSPVAKYGDKLKALLGKPAPSDEDLRDALVAQLEEAISIETAGGRVVLSVTWPDAKMAATLAKACQEEFLRARSESEVAAASSEVETLARQVSLSEERVNTIAAALEQDASARKRGAKSSSVGGLQADGRFRETPDPKLAALREELIRRRRQIESLENERRARLSALTSQLAEQRTQLTEGNPVLIDTRSKLAALEAPSAEVQAMRAEEHKLLADYVSHGGKEVELTDQPQRAWPEALKETSAASEIHRLRLAVELDQLGKLRLQLTEAKGNLDATAQGVTARYAVIKPATVPNEPNGPGTVPLLFAAFFAGLIAAVFAAVSRDLLAGRVLEKWQVERSLGLRVLSEVDRC